MITLTDGQMDTIMRQAVNAASHTYDTVQLGTVHETMKATIEELNRDERTTPPEPPAPIERRASLTLLSDDCYLLTIQNGDCSASVTLTGVQAVAWEFKEATR